MPLNHADFSEIRTFVERLLSTRGEPFVQAKVTKSDPVNKLIWCKEFGSIPIPLIGFDYKVKYKYVNAAGDVVLAETKAYSDAVQILTPRVGDLVLIAQHLGTSRLPKCLGVVKSKGYVHREDA